MILYKPEDRSIHKYPTPSAGGIPIIITFILYLLALLALYPANNISHIIMLVSVMPVLIIGSIDDLKKIGVYKRLLVHAFSAIVIVYYFQIDNNSFSVDFKGQSLMIIFVYYLIYSLIIL